LIVALDAVAHRYGIRPSALWAGCPWAFAFDWDVASRAIALTGGDNG
jgi:hypothetical protein